MAKVVAFASRLRDGLIRGLQTAGIEARVDIERVQDTKLHRVFVVADAFAQLRPAERQDLVWRIVDQSLAPDERLQISMIFTVTEGEFPDRSSSRASPATRAAAVTSKLTFAHPGIPLHRRELPRSKPANDLRLHAVGAAGLESGAPRPLRAARPPAPTASAGETPASTFFPPVPPR